MHQSCTSPSMRFGRLLALIGAALACVAVLAPAASAKEPAAGYTQFAGCPSPEENATIFLCSRTEINGGHFQMGNKDVPITAPMVLSGGLDVNGNVFASPKGGLSKAKQKVPGGVIGLTGLTWLLEFLGSEALTLYAVTELAGFPHVNSFSSVTLPIKVHLENSVLGSACYVGSFTEPIKLNLITGTTSPPPPNKPITGVEGKFSEDAKEILHIDNGTYVDNSFAAPGANGCKLVLFGFIPISINGIVNSSSGLPAAAGTNATSQDFDAELAAPELVYP